MKKNYFTIGIVISLIALLVVPSVFLIAPQRVYAYGPVVVVGDTSTTNITTMVKSTITAIQSGLNQLNTFTTKMAETARWYNENVLQPLSFVLSGNLIKMLTAGVIAFVIGKANGTGIPQFVTDVNQSLQVAADSQALAYITNVGRTNSPFSYSISSALNTDYLSRTSLRGFWIQNMNTLAASSPYPYGYLAGDWVQGGIAEWFALTTEVQNNPYTLAQASRAQLANIVGPGAGGVTGTRLAELNWGQGFFSWCGPSGSLSVSGYASTTKSINPGDPCTDKNGNKGIIKTPGSVINATLNKVLGARQDKIVRMGNVGPEINSILGNIATVVQTVKFASNILGGSSNSPFSGGLLGVGNTSSANPISRLAQFQNSSGALGITDSHIYKSAATLPSSGSDMLKRVSLYKTAWDTILATANTASTSVMSLETACLNVATSTAVSANFVENATIQANVARLAFTTEVVPVFVQVASANTSADTATSLVNKIQAELTSGNTDINSTYTSDIQTLQTKPPTMVDVANVQQNAQTLGGAVATPGGSLVVAQTSSSIVDQMTLISANADALKVSVCTIKKLK